MRKVSLNHFLISPSPMGINHICPHSKVHEANMGPIWGRQEPGGPHVGPMNFAIWVCTRQNTAWHTTHRTNFIFCFKPCYLTLNFRMAFDWLQTVLPSNKKPCLNIFFSIDIDFEMNPIAKFLVGKVSTFCSIDAHVDINQMIIYNVAEHCVIISNVFGLIWIRLKT